MTEIGPAYSVSTISILGPVVYSVREGEELALICTVGEGEKNNNLLWRRRVRYDYKLLYW